jgi:hypothetical protein
MSSGIHLKISVSAMVEDRSLLMNDSLVPFVSLRVLCASVVKKYPLAALCPAAPRPDAQTLKRLL